MISVCSFLSERGIVVGCNASREVRNLIAQILGGNDVGSTVLQHIDIQFSCSKVSTEYAIALKKNVPCTLMRFCISE